MNALSTDVEVPSVVPTRRAYVRRVRPVNTNASPRPRHAALAPADQRVPRVPHNVPCPACGVRAGVHCKVTSHNGGGPSFSHPERRLAAGQARRRQVYGKPRHPSLYGWDGGVALVVDSLPERG